MKKLGLAMGAGGSRGIAHIGFLQALEEEGVKPDCITGSSMGSVVGGAYAMGVPLRELKKAVESLRFLDILSHSTQKGGVFGTKKMRALLEKYIGDRLFEETNIPFRCVAVDMIAQEVVEFSSGSLLDAIVASSSIPGVFHPFEKDGRRLIDGGVLERVPAMRLKEMGADVIVAVDVLGKLPASERLPGTIDLLLETYDVTNNYITKLYRAACADGVDFWLEPELGNMNQYSLKRVKFAMEKGYELGKRYAPKIAELLSDRGGKRHIATLKNKMK